MWCIKSQNLEHTWTLQHHQAWFLPCSSSCEVHLNNWLVESCNLINMISYFQRNYFYYIHIFSREFFVNNKCLDKNACLLDQLDTGKRGLLKCLQMRWLYGQDWRMYMLIWNQWYSVGEWAGVHSHCMRSSTYKSPNCRQRLHMPSGEIR